MRPSLFTRSPHSAHIGSHRPKRAPLRLAAIYLSGLTFLAACAAPQNAQLVPGDAGATPSLVAADIFTRATAGRLSVDTAGPALARRASALKAETSGLKTPIHDPATRQLLEKAVSPIENTPIRRPQRNAQPPAPALGEIDDAARAALAKRALALKAQAADLSAPIHTLETRQVLENAMDSAQDALKDAKWDSPQGNSQPLIPPGSAAALEAKAADLRAPILDDDTREKLQDALTRKNAPTADAP